MFAGRLSSLCCVVVLAVSVLAVYVSADRLLQVQAVCRHGARAPLESYPTDPYQELQWGGGAANLVPAGVRDQFRLGKDLRLRYAGFLPWRDCSGVNVTTSDRSRTRDSAAALLLGMFSGTQLGSSGPQYLGGALPEHPPLCPLTTIPESEDYVLRLISAERCPALMLGIEEELRRSPEYAATAPALKNQLAEHAGVQDASSVDIVRVFDTLRAHRQLGLQLPSWTQQPLKSTGNQTVLQAMEVFFSLAFKAQGAPNLRSLSAGGLLGRMVDNMSVRDPTRFVLFSAHDTTVAALESSFGVYEMVPPTSSCVLLELHSTPSGRVVRMLRRRGDTGELQRLHLSCGVHRHWCFLKELQELPWLPASTEQVKQTCRVPKVPRLRRPPSPLAPPAVVFPY